MASLSALGGFDPKRPLHAYLLVTPSLRQARTYVDLICRALLCTSPTSDGSPCGACAACKKVALGVHPDISYLGRDKVKVDEVRGVRELAYLAPNDGERRVIVLESAENFNASSLNALLKILEEPPAGVIFLLTASAAGAVLPTVRSRACVLVPSDAAVTPDLKELFPKATESALAHMKEFLARYEQVDPSALDPEELERAFSLAYTFYKGESADPLVLALPKRREESLVFFRVLMLLAAKVCLYKLSGGKRESDGSEDFRRICARLSAARALQYYELFEKAYLMTEDYANVNALYAYLSQRL